MAQELPEGTVTVLFTDVEGSTDLVARLRDEPAREVLRACDELVRQQVARHRGREVKHTGDGLMVAFTSARRAVACAVDIQRAMAGRNRREPERAVRVRIGLNTGEVIREEADLFGATVNAAKRIADKADAGEILLSEAVKGILGAATTVELEDLGEAQLKGFPKPMRLHRVSWEEAVGPAGLALPERTPFVGRESERAELRRLLDQAVSGQGALVMIGGEPGVGKTRLAEELLLETRRRGVLTLTGHCYEMEGAPPYVPFVEILEAATRVVPAEALREALGDAAGEVAKLMPELRRLFPDVSPPLELPPEQERRYLFNCIFEFIERAARAQPLLLTLEDLHWADHSTMILLQHVAQRLGDIPVLILGTYRDVELDVGRPLARALEDLVRQRLAQRMAVKRLPEADTGAMLRVLSGQEPPDALVRVVYRETEGNPFFVEEVYQHLSEEGRLFDAEGRWRSDLRIGELEVPESIRLVIGHRLERVAEDARRVLTTAAVIGRTFSFELLEALADPSAGSGQGVEGDALLDAIDEAERAHLITSTGDGPEARFTFAHELIRQTLVSELSLPRRQRLHLRVAEAMERVYARALEEHTADLAHHLYQAGTAADPQKTVHYLTLAGEQAMAAAAFEDALGHYEASLSLQPSEDRRERAGLLMALGLAYRRADVPEKAMATLEEAVRLAERLGDPQLQGEAANAYAMAVWRGPLTWTGAAVPALERALEALGGEESALRATLLARLCVSLPWLAPREQRLATARQAKEMAERVGDFEALMISLEALHQALEGPEGTEERLAVANEWLQAAEQAGDRSQTLFARVWRVADLAELGEMDEVKEEISITCDLADQMREPFFSGWRPIWGCMLAAMEGRYEEAERLLLQYLPIAQRTQHPGYLGAVSIQLYDIRRGQGRLRELEQVVLQYLERQHLERLPDVPLTQAALAFMYLQTERPDQAREWFERLAANDFTDVPRDPQWVSTINLSADVASRLHDERRAALLYKILRPYAGRNIVIGTAMLCDGSASRCLGQLAATMGNWQDAERHFEDALAFNERNGAWPWLARTRLGYAEMLQERDRWGDREKARGLVNQALATFKELGMKKDVEMAEAMLGEL